MHKLILIFIGFIVVASSLNDARKANEAFRQGEYEKAAQLYRQAIDQNPENARLYFNLGNALSEAGRTEEAIDAYERFRNLTEGISQQALADYNQGKVLTDLEEYDEALSYFREALRKNPADADARHNYELAKQRKQQQEQDQQDQQQDSQSDENDPDGEQDQDDRQDGEQQQDPSQQSPQDQQQQDNERQPQPQNMSREEAENILDALGQLERELLEKREKEATENRPDNDKDW